MSDYQAQSVTECLSTWCTLTSGHGGGHTDLREPRTARDELARVIRDGVGVWRTPLEAADAILAAPAPRAALDSVLALHKPEKRWEPYEGAGFSYETQAEALEALGDVDVNQVVLESIAANGAPYFQVCAECGRMEAEQLQESMGEWCYRESLWPCPTIAAVKDALEGK